MRIRGFLVAFATSITVLACTPAPAPKEPEAVGCSPYQQRLHGVWLNEHQQPVQRFVFASNASGHGCYGWLTAVPQWGLHTPGSVALTVVQRSEKGWVWYGDDTRLSVDLTTGVARFENAERSLYGRLIADGEPVPKLQNL